MCGRIAQHRYQQAFLKPLGLDLPEASDSPLRRYNVAPRTLVWSVTSGKENPCAQPLRWGWAPHWAKGKPPAINARAETIWTSRYWSAARKNRLLIPADGWFEWVAEEGKQPYYIHSATDAPLYFAAVGVFDLASDEEREGDGFAIVTGGAEVGMVDIHDRRPLALAPELALEWLDSATPQERIEELVAAGGLGPESFRWHKVDRAVGNVRNQGAHLIEPI